MRSPLEPLRARDALYRAFGPRALDPGLFYTHEPALRFALSRGGSRVRQFLQAYDRAREIVGHVLGDAPHLTAVLVWYDPDRSVRSVLDALRECCGIRTSRPRGCWREPWDDGGTRTVLAFRAERAALDGLLWGALASDLGIRPHIPASLYLADVERGIMLHPYDDRGMDAVGPNHDLLAALYHRHGDCLLAYDRPRMDSFFG